MTYCMSYRAEAWVQPETGVPEWRQVVSVDLDDGTQLVAIVVRGVDGAAPRVADAQIEQACITRTVGWKRQTMDGCGRRRLSWSSSAICVYL
jgi:hypothetical protein